MVDSGVYAKSSYDNDQQEHIIKSFMPDYQNV